MSDFQKSRQIWRQKLAVQRMLLNVLWSDEVRDTDKFTADFERYSSHLESPDAIRTLFADWLETLKSGRKQPPVLKQRLRELAESCDVSLATISVSLDKARGSLAALLDIADFESDQEYDVACLFSDQVQPAVVMRVVSEWKQRLRDWIAYQSTPVPISVIKIGDESKNPSMTVIEEGERKPSVPPSSSHIFWHGEMLDAMSRYRFMETFNVGEFPETIAQIEDMFASTFTVYDPDMCADLEFDEGGPSVSGVPVFNLWLASRNTRLCSRVRRSLEMMLVYISNRQSPEGWYPSRIKHEGDEPDTYLTALACVVLLRLARSNRQLEQAKRGVQWLAKQQKPSGAWVYFKLQHDLLNVALEPDLFTTLLAVEAIRLSGLDGFEHTVSAADSWIMSQQDPDGTWKDEDFQFPFMTTLVIEYFERKRPPLSSLGSYLSIARDFILRSQELALEDNENARRLAIVVAFQGIETFLYACLSAPSVNINVFEKPDKTIGMRKALTRLQTHFQTMGVLRQGQIIEYRNELDRLAYHRDQIVHKGASVAEREARELTEASTRFSDLVCRRIFGYSLL
jgi:hypothetical protein